MGSKSDQRARRREREKGLSKLEIVAQRRANAIANNSGNVELAGRSITDTARAARGSRRTYIRRHRLIKLSEAQKHRCCYCGQQTWHPHIIDGGDVVHSKRNLATIEHVVALVSGGTWCKNNLVMACNECNGARGEKAIAKFVALITQDIDIPLSKAVKRALRKEEKRKSDKGQIKTAKTVWLLFLALTFIPELFVKVQKDFNPTKIKTRTGRCNISTIRKRVIENNMVFL